jgi:hypothetical protein
MEKIGVIKYLVSFPPNGIAKLFDKEPNSSGLGDDSYRYDEMVWDLSPIEKRSMQIQKDIAETDEVSFAPRVLIGSFHRNLGDDAYPLSSIVGALGINLNRKTTH